MKINKSIFWLFIFSLIISPLSFPAFEFLYFNTETSKIFLYLNHLTATIFYGLSFLILISILIRFNLKVKRLPNHKNVLIIITYIMIHYASLNLAQNYHKTAILRIKKNLLPIVIKIYNYKMDHDKYPETYNFDDTNIVNRSIIQQCEYMNSKNDYFTIRLKIPNHNGQLELHSFKSTKLKKDLEDNYLKLWQID